MSTVLPCVICGEDIPSARREWLKTVKTCSRLCSALHSQNLQRAANRRSKARARAQAKAATTT